MEEVLYVFDYLYNKGILELRLFLAFGVTLVFAPWGYGITYFLLFALIFEVVFFCRCETYPFKDRLGALCASILGWLLGRLLMEETRDENIMEDVTTRIREIKNSIGFIA